MMRILQRYPKWSWTFAFCAVLGFLVYRYEGIIRSIGIPLEWMWGTKKISLQHFIGSIFLVLATVWGSLWLSLSIESSLLKVKVLDINVRVMLTKVVRACLILIGLLTSASVIGLDLTVFSVLGGAMGVALGFGFQRIMACYFAGYMILLDNSLQIGHMMRVDKYYGRLTRLTSRYAVLDALDGSEIFIPNDMLIMQPVVNYAFTERAMSVPLTIIAAHHIDLELALSTLEQIGLSHQRVLKEKHLPSASVKNISELGIELELSVWITDPEEGVTVLKTELYKAIWSAFRDRGWEFAQYPGIQITSAAAPLPVPPQKV
jgi:small-conductance mechanosensitive channel